MDQRMSPVRQMFCKEGEKLSRRYRVCILYPRLHCTIPQTHCNACPLEHVAGFQSAASADNGTHRGADTGPAHTALAKLNNHETT
jgi:hypothetical protein